MIDRTRWVGLWSLVALAAACDCSADPVPMDAAVDASPAGDGSDDDSGDTPDAGALDAAADAGVDASDAGDASIGVNDGGLVRGCRSPACDLIDNGCGNARACYYLPETVGGVPQPRCFSAGDNAENTICTTQEQCAPGLGCDPNNRCRQYCCAPGGSEGCPSGQACLLEYRDDADQGLGVGLCQPCDACDPVSANGCGNNEACYPASDDGNCTLCVTPRVLGVAGASCATNGDCGPGLGCIADDANPTCARFCEVGADGCAPSETCVALGYTGLPALGICQAP